MQFLENELKGKEVVIDWFQVTFDFIPVKFDVGSNRYVLNKDNDKFIELIKILNPPSEFIKGDYEFYIEKFIEDLATKQSGRYRFDNGYMLGEHIELSFGGNKTRLESFPVILIMTGQGCREFEASGGDWIELFKFILKNSSVGYLKIGRLDLAIDDFDGAEITPYEIEKHIRNHHYISPFRKVNFNITESHSNNPETLGFAITFGSRGSNQLQIYDKKLERKANNEVDKNTDVWYRYEMRLMEDMAYTVLIKYIEAYDLDNSLDFMDYTKGVLKSLLDIKEYNPNNQQKTRWNTLKDWNNFLNSLNKVDIKRKNKRGSTIDTKIDWFKEDMATTLLEFALIYDGDDFNQYINDVISSADFKQKHLNRLNNYFKTHEKEIISMNDVSNTKNNFNVDLKDKKSEFEKLQEMFFKLENDLDDFIYTGAEEEINVFYLFDTPFIFELVNTETRFSDVRNIFYINRNELKRYVFLKNIIKTRINELKGFLK